MRAAVVLALILAGCSPSPVATTSPKPSSVSIATQAHPTPTPVGAQLALGPVDAQGVPTSLDGEAVTSGAALVDAIAKRTDATPLLAGGWFHPPVIIRYCAAFHPDPAVDTCYAFGLFERRVGGAPIWITRGDVPKANEIAGAVDRPAVLRLHTHDPRCDAKENGCDLRPVLDEIAWLGESPFESPPPREAGTPPPTSITEDEAVRRATAESMPHSTPLTLRSVSAAPIWVALPEEERSLGDIWVWVVVFEAHFVAPCGDCQGAEREEVFLDYVTGAYIMSRT